MTPAGNAKYVGYWRKTVTEASSLPHPRNLRSPGWLSPAEKPKVLGYLRSGTVIADCMGVSFCRLAGGPPDSEMGSSELSDGDWIWPEGLEVYVDRFDVRLPVEFLHHMRSVGYVVSTIDPTLASRLLIQASFDFWVAWGQAQETLRA